MVKFEKAEDDPRKWRKIGDCGEGLWGTPTCRAEIGNWAVVIIGCRIDVVPINQNCWINKKLFKASVPWRCQKYVNYVLALSPFIVFQYLQQRPRANSLCPCIPFCLCFLSFLSLISIAWCHDRYFNAFKCNFISFLREQPRLPDTSGLSFDLQLTKCLRSTKIPVILNRIVLRNASFASLGFPKRGFCTKLSLDAYPDFMCGRFSPTWALKSTKLDACQWHRFGRFCFPINLSSLHCIKITWLRWSFGDLYWALVTSKLLT